MNSKLRHAGPEPASRKCWIPAFAGMTSCIILFAGCTRSEPPLDYIGPNMVDAPSIKAQRADCRMHELLSPSPRPSPEGEGDCIRGLRVPPEGAIPTNYEPYPYPEDPEMAGRMLKNPLRPTPAMLQRGQILYTTYCNVCHGPTGDGSGSIVPKFPQPPPLFSEKVTGWSDGRIFHIITRGQNLMPSYASQLSADERWAVIQYLRVLQRAAHPTAADLKAIGKE